MSFSIPSPPTAVIEVTVDSRHAFFDQLAAAEAAMAGYILGHALHGGTLLPGGPIFHVCFTEQAEIDFDPAQVLDALMKRAWPTQIRLTIRPAGIPPDPSVRTATPDGIQRLMGSMHQYAFLSYYENVSDRLKATYGNDPRTWPQTPQLAWIVRNAFAHGGQITIRDTIVTATWRGLTLSHANHGQQLLYNHLTAGDLILLMLDLEDAL